MALFTKLRERVVGSSVKFDNLEQISKYEDSKNGTTEDMNLQSNVFPLKRKDIKSNLAPRDDTNKENGKFSNIMLGDSANIHRSRDEPISVDAVKLTYSKAPQLVNRPNEPEARRNLDNTSDAMDTAGKDNRFATSRSVSSIKIQTNTAKTAIPAVVETSTANVDGTEEVDENSEHDDQIEHIFSKARHNHAAVVISALQAGFHVNTTDGNGNTLLHICAQNNHKKLASALILNFPMCNINAENFKSLTPLDYARKYGFEKLATWLESAGATCGSGSSKQAASQSSITKLR